MVPTLRKARCAAVKVLKVSTGHVSAPGPADREAGRLDYGVYERVPRLWRRLEQMARLDIHLALRARRAAKDYDVVLAESEKVGIPLALLAVGKPIVTLTHALESFPKRVVLRVLSVPRRWAAVGFSCAAGGDFLCSYYGVRREQTFPFVAANLRQFTPGPGAAGGAILSLGVAGRDYDTLLRALADLPGYETVVHLFSRHGDRYRGRSPRTVPEWVRFAPATEFVEIPGRYRDARFVVLPLRRSAHWGAGLTVALEAAASGRAVIATDTPGMRSAIVDGVTGLLVPARDPAALREAMRALWSAPESAAVMGQAARRHVERHFHPDEVRAIIDTMLQRVAAAAAE